jgi:hypothetical protein
MFARHLGKLALVGQDFYVALFLDVADTLGLPKPDLPIDSVVQITPLDATATAPWSIMYVYPINENPPQGAWTLCPDFPHDGRECPHEADANVVCPHGFWGYRYVIEQLPIAYHERDGVDAEEQALARVIRNFERLYVGAATHYEFYDRSRGHLKRLVDKVQSAGVSDRLRVKLAQTESVLREQLRAQNIADWATPHILYFFSHGQKLGRSSLVIGDAPGHEQAITAAQIKRIWKAEEREKLNSAFVVMNGCSTGNYGPWDYGSLISAFMDAHASGVIGTQCTIYDVLAQEFGYRFFLKMFQQHTAGRALQEATRDLMALYNPFGLVYGLFASADLILAQRVM